MSGSTVNTFAHYLYSGGSRAKKLVIKDNGDYESVTYIDGVFEYHKKVTTSTTEQKNYILLQGNVETRIGGYSDDDSETTLYTISDHLSSAAIRLKDDGALYDKEEYYPYGDSSLKTYGKKRYRYTGKEKDNESGLYYYSARYYAPWTCKFLSVDPLAGKYAHQSSYCYADCNPVVKNDPSGMGPGEGENSGYQWSNQGKVDGSTKVSDTDSSANTHGPQPANKSVPTAANKLSNGEKFTSGFVKGTANNLKAMVSPQGLATMGFIAIAASAPVVGPVVLAGVTLWAGVNAMEAAYKSIENLAQGNYEAAGESTADAAINAVGAYAGAKVVSKKVSFEAPNLEGIGEGSPAAKPKPQANSATVPSSNPMKATNAAEPPASSVASQPKESIGGSIKEMNKVGGDKNCANTTIGTEYTLRGQKNSALASGVTSTTVIEAEFNAKFTRNLSLNGVLDRVKLPGQRGIIFGNRGEGMEGHFFNVANQKGKINFIDGQRGGAAILEGQGYKSFWFLPTN